MFVEETQSPYNASSHLNDDQIKIGRHIEESCLAANISDPVSWMRDIDARLSYLPYWIRLEHQIKFHKYMCEHNHPRIRGNGMRQKYGDVSAIMIEQGIPLIMEKLNRPRCDKQYFFGNFSDIDMEKPVHVFEKAKQTRRAQLSIMKDKISRLIRQVTYSMRYWDGIKFDLDVLDWISVLCEKDHHTFIVDFDVLLRRAYSIPMFKKGAIDDWTIALQCGDPDIVKVSLIFTNVNTATDDNLSGYARSSASHYGSDITFYRSDEPYTPRMIFEHTRTVVGGAILGNSPSFEFVESSPYLIARGININSKRFHREAIEKNVVYFMEGKDHNLFGNRIPTGHSEDTYGAIIPKRISAIKNDHYSALDHVEPTRELLEGWHFCPDSMMAPMYLAGRDGIAYQKSFDGFVVNGLSMAQLSPELPLEDVVMMAVEEQLILKTGTALGGRGSLSSIDRVVKWTEK